MLHTLPKLKYTGESTFFLIAGPCVVESEDITKQIAHRLQQICNRHRIPLIFKASYRKANRTRIDSFTGLGDELALQMLNRIGEEFQLPILTDIHQSDEAEIAAEYVDVLQIPAFLCRQTDLLVAAGKTGKTVNVKKGQFSSPESMKFAIEKIHQTGNHRVLLTERGTTFGYHDLVVDFRGFPIMKSLSCPLIMDITHSVQQPNQTSGVTGGRPELISTMAKAALAAGADGIFLETHPNPAEALSDGANMIALDRLEEMLCEWIPVYRSVNKNLAQSS